MNIKIKNFKKFVNENIEFGDNLSKHEKYQLLKHNNPIIVYRGVHKSGKNFYTGDKKLPFTYYSLTKEKAEIYAVEGNVNTYTFNEKSLPIKIFKGSDLFDKFGLNGNVENKNVIDTLINDGYSAVLIKGDELVVFDDSLIKEVEFLTEENKKMDNMKDLVIQALNDAFSRLNRQIPQTKKKNESVSILGVNPIDIISFMKNNNIPNDASFDGKDNGYDAWDDILLSWEIDIPTTDKDKLIYKRGSFTTMAFRSVYDLLLKNGFKRVGYNTGLLKQFDNTTVYDMYINNDFDRLVSYYSLPFIKEHTKI